MTERLTSGVIELCDEALDGLVEEKARTELLKIRSGLSDPLRVAVAGRVKAGKSTLVNALLRQRVAQTAVGECTKVVSWYRYDHNHGQVEIKLRNGTSDTTSVLDDGTLPDVLGFQAAEIDFITVGLSNTALRSMTIIDTPGLSSANSEYTSRTEELLAVSMDGATRSATAEADALIFMMSRTAMQDDVEALRAFRAQFGGLRGSAINAVGVLSRIDEISTGDTEPLEEGSKIAARLADELGPLVSAVLPVIGLLAETAQAEAFTDRDFRNLQTIAALDPDIRELMLLSVDEFVMSECSISSEDRRQLLSLLGWYGVRKSLQVIDQGRAENSTSLLEELSGLSGFEALQTLLEEAFQRRADPLKADWALSALERLAWSNVAEDRGSLNRLRTGIEKLRLDPEMHELNLFSALRKVAAGRVQLPHEMVTELRRLAEGGSTAARLGLPPETSLEDLQRSSLQAASRWKAYGHFPSTDPESSRLADDVARSYTAIYEILQRDATEAR